MARWVRRPALAVALLGVAVAVSVVEGQPPPAARDSGVSVDADKPYPWPVGTLLVVADGRLVRFDTDARRIRTVPLPAGLTALRVWSQDGGDLVLGRLPTGRTAAYLLAPGRPATALGPAEVAVPSADRTAVWLVVRRTATRVPLAGGPREKVSLPRGARLVADTAYGLIVSTGTVPDPLLPGRRETPTPTLSASSLPTPTTGPQLSPSPTPQTPPPPASGPGPDGTAGPVSPTPPPYTTASPVPSTGPDGVPLTTLVVGRDSSVRFIAAAEALAATGDIVLLRDERRRLGVVSPRPGFRKPRWLPKLNAVEAIGPGTLDARGETFAVLARTNDYAWLMAGPTSARTEAAINVVALVGGPPVPSAAPPAFTASGRVLTTRPDGRIVYYAPGERSGYTLGDDLPAASAVSQG
jgi:hypothetical protein